ncbi:MAG TPA: tetratricopeptide repeat protein [Desulfuromonadales bacterium]|nr:tetratricopeptide repeat protein [Desulfuromonadales bacterium]
MNAPNEQYAIKNKVFDLSKRGHALLKSGRSSEARLLFEEAISLGTRNAHVLTGMGDLLRQQKDFTGAAAYYRQVLEDDPGNIFSLRGLGDALRGLGEYREAIGFWETYLRLHNGNDICVLTRIADSYKTIDNYDTSRDYYHKALVLNARDRYALMGLADLYHKRGHELQAIEYYEKALANGVTLINILTIVANLHWRHEHYEQAREYYEKALVQDPYNSYALYGLGNYYRWKCDYQRAVDMWERILERSPGTANVMVRLGDAYCTLGQLEAAARVYTKNLDSAYDMLSLVGMLKIRCLQNQPQAACDCYDELLRREGDDIQFMPKLAELLLRQADRETALFFFTHVKKCYSVKQAALQTIEAYISQAKGT